MKFDKVLITGGSSGIGQELVSLLLEEGAEVHMISRTLEDKIDSMRLNFYPLDLVDSDSTYDFAQNFIKSHGIPDLIINNAGAGAFFEWDSFPKTQIKNQINLLFLSPVFICKAFAPEMASLNSGKIVNITSLANLYPVPYMPIYNSCKSALSSFTRSLQIEYESKPAFIDVVLGDVKTDFNSKIEKNNPNVFGKSADAAWNQVEKQLRESPTPDIIAKRLFSKIKKSRGGVIYEGGLTHRIVYPFLSRFLTQFLKNKILQRRYFR